VTDTQQPGVEVDGELWEEFREEVRARRGGIRGHLKTELEAALREYIEGGDPTPDQINARLQRIEDAVGVAGTDGGADLRSAEPHTQTETAERDIPKEKPAAKAARSQKLSYLTGRVREEEAGSVDADIGKSLKAARITEIVDAEYGFAEETTEEYVEQIRERLGLVDHPTADPLLCTPERRKELGEESASDRLEEL